jgi:hypothetical protein
LTLKPLKGGKKMSFARFQMRYKSTVVMELRRSEAKQKAHQREKAEPKRMSFAEIMRLVTKRPVVDRRPQWLAPHVNAK